MLPEYWEDRLKKNNITNESNALRILESMNEAASSSAISAKTSVTNDNLRKHAKSAFMKFDSNDAFRYLEDDFDKDFNALDEIRIHDALKTRHQKRALPPLIRWVAMAKNERFKAFLISEIAYFNQNENADQILEIFKKNNNTTVKSAAAETLGKLKYDRATPSLISNYPYSNTKVQNSIIKALGNFEDNTVLNFLEKISKEVHNKEIQILILEQIYKIDLTSNRFKKLKENSNSEFEKSIFDYIEQGYAV